MEQLELEPTSYVMPALEVKDYPVEHHTGPEKEFLNLKFRASGFVKRKTTHFEGFMAS